jgi:hypothetical protein
MILGCDLMEGIAPGETSDQLRSERWDAERIVCVWTLPVPSYFLSSTPSLPLGPAISSLSEALEFE